LRKEEHRAGGKKDAWAQRRKKENDWHRVCFVKVAVDTTGEQERFESPRPEPSGKKKTGEREFASIQHTSYTCSKGGERIRSRQRSPAKRQSDTTPKKKKLKNKDRTGWVAQGTCGTKNKGRGKHIGRAGGFVQKSGKGIKGARRRGGEIQAVGGDPPPPVGQKGEKGVWGGGPARRGGQPSC